MKGLQGSGLSGRPADAEWTFRPSVERSGRFACHLSLFPYSGLAQSFLVFVEIPARPRLWARRHAGAMVGGGSCPRRLWMDKATPAFPTLPQCMPLRFQTKSTRAADASNWL